VEVLAGLLPASAAAARPVLVAYAVGAVLAAARDVKDSTVESWEPAADGVLGVCIVGSFY
jgi:hypothetical protein